MLVLTLTPVLAPRSCRWQQGRRPPALPPSAAALLPHPPHRRRVGNSTHPPTTSLPSLSHPRASTPLDAGGSCYHSCLALTTPLAPCPGALRCCWPDYCISPDAAAYLFLTYCSAFGPAAADSLHRGPDLGVWWYLFIEVRRDRCVTHVTCPRNLPHSRDRTSCPCSSS